MFVIISGYLNNSCSKPVIVAIIDTEYTENSYYDANIWRNTMELSSNGIDDDHNGYIDDCCGWNFCKDKAVDCGAATTDSHGSIVVKAFQDELKDCSDDSIKVMLLTALDADNKGNVNNIVEAIEYAENNGARLCNLSVSSYTDNDILKKAIAQSKMNFIVPSGNDGMELNDEFKCFPATYTLRNITVVGSLDKNGNVSEMSNYGSEYVDEYYCGTVICCGKKYEGTSVACAKFCANKAIGMSRSLT